MHIYIYIHIYTYTYIYIYINTYIYIHILWVPHFAWSGWNPDQSSNHRLWLRAAGSRVGGLKRAFCHRCDRVHTFGVWVWSPNQCWWIWPWTAFWTACLAKTAESLSQGIVGMAWICSSGYHQFSHRRLITTFTDGSHFVGFDHWDQRDHLHSLSVASSQSSCSHS